MMQPMIIIENKYPLPEEIRSWAALHSVPVCDDQKDSSSYSYKYVFEYSDEITLEALEIAYCHAVDKPAVIGMTERLIIREIGLDDLDDYRRIVRLYPEVLIDRTLSELSPEEFKYRHEAYIKYSYHFLGYGIYGIFPRDTELKPVSGCSKVSKMIGIAGIDGTVTPQLSYALLPEYRGMGIAFEACDRILEYAESSLELKNINLFIHEENTASILLAEKLKKKHSIIIHHLQRKSY